MQSHPFGKLLQIGRERRRLLLRASAVLTIASAAIAFLSFRRAIRLGSAPLGARTGSVDDVVWAVEAAAKRLAWRTLCFEKGLAVQRLLRRRGFPAVLHYGARHNPQNGALEAHVWVSVDGAVVIGGDNMAGFAEVAAYP